MLPNDDLLIFHAIVETEQITVNGLKYSSPAILFMHISYKTACLKKKYWMDLSATGQTYQITVDGHTHSSIPIVFIHVLCKTACLKKMIVRGLLCRILIILYHLKASCHIHLLYLILVWTIVSFL